MYGTYVVLSLEPDCWVPDRVDRAKAFARGIVFSTWGFMIITWCAGQRCASRSAAAVCHHHCATSTLDT